MLTGASEEEDVGFRPGGIDQHPFGKEKLNVGSQNTKVPSNKTESARHDGQQNLHAVNILALSTG